jgi:SPFH domain / Band 7 family
VFGTIFRAISDGLRALRPWITVLPWQLAVRVRLGKHLKQLGPGIHLKVPFADSIFLANTRLRTLTTARQVITTQDQVAITVAMNVAFQIRDPVKLHMTLHAPAETIGDLAMSLASQWVSERVYADVSPAELGDAVAGQLHLEAYGLEAVRVYVSEFAAVRTYRLLGDNNGSFPYISTSTPVVSPAGED